MDYAVSSSARLGAYHTSKHKDFTATTASQDSLHTQKHADNDDKVEILFAILQVLFSSEMPPAPGPSILSAFSIPNDPAP